MFSPESQRAIVEECHRAGIIAQTHTMSVDSLRQGIEAGIDMGQHMEITGPEPIPDEIVKLMLAKKIYAAVQPSTVKESIAHAARPRFGTLSWHRLRQAARPFQVLVADQSTRSARRPIRA